MAVVFPSHDHRRSSPAGTDVCISVDTLEQYVLANLDCSAGDQYITSDASGVLSCGTDDDSGGTTAINDLGDATANGSVSLTTFEQNWLWDTGTTVPTGYQGMSWSFTKDATTDSGSQTMFRLAMSDSGNDAAGNMESIIQIDNGDTNDPVDDAIEIVSLGGGITNGISMNDADIVNLLDHIGGNLTSGS